MLSCSSQSAPHRHEAGFRGGDFMARAPNDVTQRASSDFRLDLHWSLRCQAASIALGSHQLVQQSASALDGLVFGLVLCEVDALSLRTVFVTDHELRRLSRNEFDLAVVLIDPALALDPRLDVGVLVQLSSGARFDRARARALGKLGVRGGEERGERDERPLHRARTAAALGQRREG